MLNLVFSNVKIDVEKIFNVVKIDVELYFEMLIYL
jgi:hypothetical protein